MPPVARKSANVEKSERKTGRSTLFQPGPDPRRGRGPAPGAPNAGRPRDEWKAALAALASSDEVLAHVRRVLADPDHPQWMRALEYASERGFGKETATVEQSGAVEVRVTYEGPGGRDGDR
jgi:hypothetical protein